MNIKFRVELSQSERDQLDALLSAGRHATRKIKRAQILTRRPLKEDAFMDGYSKHEKGGEFVTYARLRAMGTNGFQEPATGVDSSGGGGTRHLTFKSKEYST